MTNYYKIYKDKIQKEFDDFPIAFAFNRQQFEEELAKLGVEKKDLVSIGAGGFIRKSDVKAFNLLMKRKSQTLKTLLKDNNFFKEAIKYELCNHEYTYTHDVTDALLSLGLTISSLTEEQRKILSEVKNRLSTTER